MNININHEDIKNISILELSSFWTFTVSTKDGARVDFTMSPEHIEYILEAVATQKKVHEIMEAFKALNA
jgi:hypothetical protein